MEKTSSYGSKYTYDPDFNGPLKKRSCTDIGFLPVFLAFIITWTFIAAFSFPMGNPEKLIHPTDSTGRICGGNDPLVKNKPFLFFFDISQCKKPSALLSGCETPQVCVENCPRKNFNANVYLKIDMQKQTKRFKEFKDQLICTYDVGVIKSLTHGKELIENHKCAYEYNASIPISGRCIPEHIVHETKQFISKLETESDDDIKDIFDNLEKLADFQETGEKLYQDIWNSKIILILALVEVALISLLYIFLIKVMAEPLIWITLVGISTLMTFGIVESWCQYMNTTPNSKMSLPLKFADVYNGNIKGFLLIQETWLTIMIAEIILLTIILFITIGLRNRLRIAIGLLQEASKAIDKMKATLFFPLIIHLLQMLVISYGITLALYIATSGQTEYKVYILDKQVESNCDCNYKSGDSCDPATFSRYCHEKENNSMECTKAKCSYFSYNKHPYNHVLHIFNIIAVIWTYLFISAFAEIILASAFATWYWTYKKLENFVELPLLVAAYRTLRYHLGTVALGSCLLTVCLSIRIILDFIDMKLKKYSEKNKIFKIMLSCCRVCSWLLKKFFKFLSKNAYIMCAIHGTSFCLSAKSAFHLIMRNIIRSIVLNNIYQFILFLGKLLIIIATATQWYYILTGHIEFLNNYIPDLNYPVLILLIIIISTYFITNTFFNVYSIAVDTIFLCFLEDIERNDGSSQKPYYMSNSLKIILNKD